LGSFTPAGATVANEQQPFGQPGLDPDTVAYESGYPLTKSRAGLMIIRIEKVSHGINPQIAADLFGQMPINVVVPWNG
jgi:hypothetical protein